MSKGLTSATRNRLAIAAILLAMVLFVAFNILTRATLTQTRLDLTEQRLFTLSEGTRKVLGEIDEPLTLRFYLSKALVETNPYYGNHARRVEELLREYERLADGGIRLQVYDPEAFSPEEDQAVAEGLQGAALAAGAGVVYFGLTGFNATDDSDVIPFFQPERAAFLEYDLTRLVHNLANPEKPKVAVLGALPLQGDGMTGFRPWLATSSLAQFFDLSFLEAQGETLEIGEQVGVLLLAQPEGLSQGALYAIDQFVLRGGRVLALIDPWSEALSEINQRSGGYVSTGAAEMAPLLAAWGLEIDPETIVGDRLSARKVAARVRGRQVVTEYVPWLSLGAERLAAEDTVTAELQVINLNAAGAITAVEGATTTLEPLIISSEQSLPIAVSEIQVAPDPVALLAKFLGPGEPKVLAARITGAVESAFPDGPPEALLEASEDAEALKQAHLAKSDGAANLIVIADSDLLVDSVWSRADNLFGQRLALPIANNVDLVVNSLDNLSGSEGLISLRGRALVDRPLTLIQNIQRDAELEYRQQEQAIVERIEKAEQEIARLQQEEQATGILQSAEADQALAKLRSDLIQARRELRDVQRALRQDIGEVEAWVKGINIWGMPLVTVVIAAGVLWLRRRRAARSAQSGTARAEATA
ncbi:MAG: Gldg family protein [Kiloniellales bacterium]|nr:Gldg family protein [Kiloniellales bacterium]MDJ0981224.1 Gldg family protein [Kiloniellales bacterium]